MKHQSYDAVVVGAGIWGCTVARRLADKGRNVLVLERCSKTGGACSSHFDINTGDEVHDHGPHIFHTDDEGVWRFVGRFAEFNHYRHSVADIFQAHGGNRANGLRDRSRLAYTAGFYNNIVKTLLAGDVTQLLYEIHLQRAADTTILQRHQTLVLLPYHAAFLYQIGIDIHFAYIINNHSKTNTTAIV